MPTTKNSQTKRRRRVVLYARVSKLAQADSISLEEQFMAMEQFARRHKMDIVGRDMDEASAYGPQSMKRPGFQAALREAAKHDAALLVFNLSRLSRWSPTVDIIRARKLRVYSVDIGYVSLPRLRAGIAKAQADSELKAKSQRALNALNDLRAPRGTLTAKHRRDGTIRNGLRSDDNNRAAASYLLTVPGFDAMTHEQRAACLRAANIQRVMNTATKEAKDWDREALRKRWAQIELEIALMREDDTPGEEAL